MPSKIITELNKTVQTEFVASEVNANPGGFYVGVTLNPATDRNTYIEGIHANIICFTTSDATVIRSGRISLQRNLLFNVELSFNAQEDPNNRMFYTTFGTNGSSATFTYDADFSSPLNLPPGYPYAIMLSYDATGPISGVLRASLTIRATSASNNLKPFPYTLR